MLPPNRKGFEDPRDVPFGHKSVRRPQKKTPRQWNKNRNIFSNEDIINISLSNYIRLKRLTGDISL